MSEVSFLQMFVLIILSYVCIYFGYIIGKWSNDELKYKNYFYAYLFLFLIFSMICFSLNYFIAPAILLLIYLLFKTSYIWNLMSFFVGLSLVMSPYFDFCSIFSGFYFLTFGAMVRTKVAYPEKGEKAAKNVLKKSFALMFLNSLGFFAGLLVGFLIKAVF